MARLRLLDILGTAGLNKLTKPKRQRMIEIRSSGRPDRNAERLI